MLFYDEDKGAYRGAKTVAEFEEELEQLTKGQDFYGANGGVSYFSKASLASGFTVAGLVILASAVVLAFVTGEPIPIDLLSPRFLFSYLAVALVCAFGTGVKWAKDRERSNEITRQKISELKLKIERHKQEQKI